MCVACSQYPEGHRFGDLNCSPNFECESIFVHFVLTLSTLRLGKKNHLNLLSWLKSFNVCSRVLDAFSSYPLIKYLFNYPLFSVLFIYMLCNTAMFFSIHMLLIRNCFYGQQNINPLFIEQFFDPLFFLLTVLSLCAHIQCVGGLIWLWIEYT